MKWGLLMKMKKKFFDRLIDEIKKYYLDGMENQNEKDYLIIVSNYIQYYHCRAWRCKVMYYVLCALKVALVASITISCVISSEYRLYSVAASAMILFLERIIDLFKFKEKWILYRNTNNILMHEIRCYVACDSNESNSNERFMKFVNSVEKIIGNEAEKWDNTVEVERNDEKAYDYDKTYEDEGMKDG